MEAKKVRRLRNERNGLLRERLPILRKFYEACVSTYPVNSIIPTAADLFLDPFVQNIIINTPSVEPFTDKDLAEVEAALPDIIFRWRKQTEEKLLNMITQACGIQDTTESILQLATTVFSCKSCSAEALTYPRVLVHHCATDYYYPREVDEDLSAVHSFLGRVYWNNGNRISFDAQKITPLIEAIKLCGLDPKSATGEDMDKRNAIFECHSCNDARKGRCTLTWKGVVCLS